jgi:Leucine-rich repeat (LRR) protein
MSIYITNTLCNYGPSFICNAATHLSNAKPTTQYAYAAYALGIFAAAGVFLAQKYFLPHRVTAQVPATAPAVSPATTTTTDTQSISPLSSIPSSCSQCFYSEVDHYRPSLLFSHNVVFDQDQVTACNSMWKNIASHLGFKLSYQDTDPKGAVKTELLKLIQECLNWRYHTKPGNLHWNQKTATISSLKDIVDCKKAYDTLRVWCCLADKIQQPITYEWAYNTVLFRANIAGTGQFKGRGFSDWMANHRTALEKVTELDLSSEALHFLPPQIQQLTGLKKLNLQWNYFRTLPEEVISLPNLEVLQWKTVKNSIN